tara:strand:+ start:3167 stop:3508 length:342 start_codon:yes stop_codon:yes gene_type:complete
MSKVFTLLREVTQAECRWLDRTIAKGETAHEYTRPTYGVIGRGVAVTLVPDEMTFFELPRDALFTASAVYVHAHAKCEDQWDGGWVDISVSAITAGTALVASVVLVAGILIGA